MLLERHHDGRFGLARLGNGGGARMKPVELIVVVLERGFQFYGVLYRSGIGGAQTGLGGRQQRSAGEEEMFHKGFRP